MYIRNLTNDSRSTESDGPQTKQTPRILILPPRGGTNVASSSLSIRGWEGMGGCKHRCTYAGGIRRVIPANGMARDKRTGTSNYQM